MQHRSSLRAFVLISALCLGSLPVIGQVSDEDGDLDLTSRPGSNDEPTIVYFYCALTDIHEVIDANQTIEASLAVNISWKDERLAHDDDESRIRNLNQIWDPGIVVLNADELQIENAGRVEVQPDGTVILEEYHRGSFYQAFDLRDFPFDRQELVITFLSPGNRPSEVMVEPHPDRPTRISPRFSLPDWSIQGWRIEHEVVKFTENVPGRSHFRLIVEARRGTAYFIFKVIIPMILIMFMSWLVYWIHPSKVDAQIGVGATSMLTLIAFRFTVDRLLPEISYLTRLDLFILLSMVLVFANLTESVATAHLYSSGRERVAVRIDTHGRWLYLVLLATLVFFTLIV